MPFRTNFYYFFSCSFCEEIKILILTLIALMARSWADSAYYERRRTLTHTKTCSYYGELSSHLAQVIKYGTLRCFTQETRCQIQRETKPTLSVSPRADLEIINS
jgi:hypothetical protein